MLNNHTTGTAHDTLLILSVRYRDWHRVERAMQMFANKAKLLRERGWADHVVTALVERPPERVSTAFQLPRERAQILTALSRVGILSDPKLEWPE